MQDKWWIVISIFLIGIFGLAGLVIFLTFGGKSNGGQSVVAQAPTTTAEVRIPTNPIFNDLILLTSRLPESCDMHQTPLRIVREEFGQSEMIDTNPFVTSNQELISEYIQAIELSSLPSVNSMMFALYYADYVESRQLRGSSEPDFHDEVGWVGLEFESQEDTGKAASYLVSDSGSDPARLALYSKDNVLVWLFRDSERYGSECFAYLRNSIQEIVR